jgi:uncharacterized protein (DUF1684 family)
MSTPAGSPELQLTDWRRQVNELYAEVRASADPADGHAHWRAGREQLFQAHPQSPLLPDDQLRRDGLPYWPYDPSLRFQVPLLEAPEEDLEVPTSSDGIIRLRRAGRVELPLGIALDVWWLRQYGGGLFIPLRDATSGVVSDEGGSYGGGRYLLDTAKGADLGGSHGEIVIDLNFAYHPSCRYNPRWECPLAPAGNRTSVAVRAGERMTSD